MKLSREDFILIKKCISLVIDQKLKSIEVYVQWDKSNIIVLDKLEKELKHLIELEEKLK